MYIYKVTFLGELMQLLAKEAVQIITEVKI